MRFAGHGHRHVRAAVERIFKGNDGRALGISAGDLDSVLGGLSAGVDEQRFLSKISRRERVEPFADGHVAFVRQHIEAGVQELVELATNGFDDAGRAMACIEAADASGEVDEAIAIDIFYDRPVGLGDKDGVA